MGRYHQHNTRHVILLTTFQKMSLKKTKLISSLLNNSILNFSDLEYLYLWAFIISECCGTNCCPLFQTKQRAKATAPHCTLYSTLYTVQYTFVQGQVMLARLSLKSVPLWLQQEQQLYHPMLLLPGDGGQGVQVEAALLLACSPPEAPPDSDYLSLLRYLSFFRFR